MNPPKHIDLTEIAPVDSWSVLTCRDDVTTAVILTINSQQYFLDQDDARDIANGINLVLAKLTERANQN